jgi:hypothetical protein
MDCTTMACISLKHVGKITLVVQRNLNKLKSEMAKYKALKENILIQVKGFRWEWCKHAWSKNGRKYTIDELADHLHRIIKEERGHKIPHEPVINVPKRLNLPILGTQTDVSRLERYCTNVLLAHLTKVRRKTCERARPLSQL